MQFIKLHDKNDNAHWVNMAQVKELVLVEIPDNGLMTRIIFSNSIIYSPSDLDVLESPRDILTAIGQYKQPSADTSHHTMD